MTEKHRPGLGAIFGIVTEEGVAKDASPVYLYDMRRWEGKNAPQRIAKQLTESSGGFSFTGLNPNYGDYMVMATDEDGAEPKNALVQDRVNPIPANSGIANFAEWYARARRWGMEALIAGWPVEEAPIPRFFSPFSRPQYSNEAVDPTNVLAGTPTEFPEMAGISGSVTGGYWSVLHPAADSSPSGRAMEFIVDIDSIVAEANGTPTVLGVLSVHSNGSNNENYQLDHTTGSMSSSGYAGGAFYVIITPALSLQIRGAPQATSPLANTPLAGTLLATIDLGTYVTTGVHHIIVSYQSVVGATLFIDGQQVNFTGSVLALPAHTATAKLFIVRDDSATLHAPLGVTTVFALAATYSQPINSTKALELYKALYDNDLPALATGTVSIAASNLALSYYRLDDYRADHAFCNESLSFTDPVTGDNQTTAMTAVRLGIAENVVDELFNSPIAGRNTALFARDAGNLFQCSSGTIDWAFADQGSYTGWMYFSDETTPSTEYPVIYNIARSSASDTAATFSIARSTDNKLTMRIRCGGTYQDVTFADYTVEHAKWLFVAITIDKTGRENSEFGVIKLYVGDTVNAPTLRMTVLTDLLPLRTAASLGSGIYTIPSVIRFTRLMSGATCEHGRYPLVLTPAAIEAIWTAKDVP